MLYEVTMLDFKMATACNFVAGPVLNPFILQLFVAFAEPGLLLMISLGVANCRLQIHLLIYPCLWLWLALAEQGWSHSAGYAQPTTFQACEYLPGSCCSPSERYRIATSSVLFFLRKYTAYAGGTEGSRRRASRRTHLLLNYSFNY